MTFYSKVVDALAVRLSVQLSMTEVPLSLSHSFTRRLSSRLSPQSLSLAPVSRPVSCHVSHPVTRSLVESLVPSHPLLKLWSSSVHWMWTSSWFSSWSALPQVMVKSFMSLRACRRESMVSAVIWIITPSERREEGRQNNDFKKQVIVIPFDLYLQPVCRHVLTFDDAGFG